MYFFKPQGKNKSLKENNDDWLNLTGKVKFNIKVKQHTRSPVTSKALWSARI